MNKLHFAGLLIAGLVSQVGLAQAATPLAVTPVVLPTPSPAVTSLALPESAAKGKGGGKKAKAAPAKSHKAAGKGRSKHSTKKHR